MRGRGIISGHVLVDRRAQTLAHTHLGLNKEGDTQTSHFQASAQSGMCGGPGRQRGAMNRMGIISGPYVNAGNPQTLPRAHTSLTEAVHTQTTHHVPRSRLLP